MSNYNSYLTAVATINKACETLNRTSWLLKQVGIEKPAREISDSVTSLVFAISEIEKYSSEVLDERVKTVDEHSRNLLNMALIS
jgi:hypothetical protein